MGLDSTMNHKYAIVKAKNLLSIYWFLTFNFQINHTSLLVYSLHTNE